MKALSSVLIVVALAQASPLKQGSPPPRAMSVYTTFEPGSLSGKPTVSVTLENLGESAKTKGGLSRTQIVTEVELELRRHGIRVARFDENKPLATGITCYVDVGTMILEGGGFVYHVRMIGTQTVRLDRNALVTVVGATTWQTLENALGICPAHDLKTVVSEAVRDKTREFANAYLAANAGQ